MPSTILKKCPIIRRDGNSSPLEISQGVQSTCTLAPAPRFGRGRIERDTLRDGVRIANRVPRASSQAPGDLMNIV